MKSFHCCFYLFLFLSETLLLSAYDFIYHAGNITGSHSQNGYSYTLSVTKGNLGTSYDFDTRGGVTSGSPSNMNISVTSAGATGTVHYAEDAPPTGNFTISMSGLLIPPEGETDGSQPSWFGDGNAIAPYRISSNQDGGAKDIVVPAGASVTYTAYEGNSTKASNWTVNGQTKNNESSIIFNRSWWDVPGWFLASMGTPDPGVYNISAVPTDRPGVSDSGKMTVVGIDRISPITLDENVAFMRVPEDENPNYLLFVESGKSLRLRAYQEWAPNWPLAQPEWSSSGSWLFSNHIIGEKDGVDTVSIDTSEDNDEFTITVTCGTSAKNVTVRTFKYNFNVYADMPEGSGDSPFSLSLFGVIDVGHAWWKLELSNEDIMPEDLNITTNKNFVNTPMGYYPKNIENINASNDFSDPGTLVKNDNSHSPDRMFSVPINREKFLLSLEYSSQLDKSNIEYVIAEEIIVTETPNSVVLPIGTYCSNKSEFNCVSAIIGAANVAGVMLPDSKQVFQGEWFTLNGYLRGTYRGHTPKKLGSGF